MITCGCGSRKNSDMKLEDLKSGYLVQIRDGRYFMVLRVGKFTKVIVNGGECIYLSNYDESLRSKSKKLVSYGRYHRKDELDIVKVYGLVQGIDNYTHALQLHESCLYRDLLWSRSEAVRMTMDELCEKLGYEVEIIREEE